MTIKLPRVSVGRGTSSLARTARAVWLVGAAIVFSFGLVGQGFAKINPGEIDIETPVYSIAGPFQDSHEVWNYSFSWSGIPVGTCSIESEIKASEDREDAELDVRIQGSSNSFLDIFWRYRLDATGGIRTDPFLPSGFQAFEEERKKRKKTDIAFSPQRVITSSRQKGDKVDSYEFEGPNTQTIISAVFLALNLDHEVGEEYQFDTFTGTSRYLVDVKVEGRETIDAAGVPTDAFRLMIATNALTDPEDNEKHRATELWVSAQKPRRMLRARSKTFVGAIHVNLESVVDAAKSAQPVADGEGDSR